MYLYVYNWYKTSHFLRLFLYHKYEYEYQCLNQDSNLPLALEEKEEERTLWYESGPGLPWLPSFNSLFKTSTLKKKICSLLGE